MTAARIEFLALAGLSGNLLAQQLPALPDQSLLAPLWVIGLLLCCRRRTLLCGFVVVFFSLTVTAAHIRLADRWPGPGAQTDIELHGWIDEFPVADSGRVVFTVRTSAADRALGLPRRIRLTWYDAPFVPAPGMSLALAARIRPPRGLANPGGFDYERWLLTEGIGATGYVRRGDADGGHTYGLAQSLLKLRYRTARSIADAVEDTTAGALIAALAVGVRTGFTERQWETLRRTGTSHLVAISGLHIGLVALFGFQALRCLALRMPPAIARRAWTVSSLGAMLPACGYAALAGFALPTVRAVLMLAMALAILVSRRRVIPLAALSAAMLVVLSVDPMATLGASFWLSFAAVAAIVLFVSRMQVDEPAASVVRDRHMPKAVRAVRSLVAIQFVVGLGLMPFAVIFFGEVSMAGFPVNLAAVPFFSFVLVPVSLMLTIAVLVGIGAQPLGHLAGLLAGGVWCALDFAAGVPHASVEVAFPSLATVLLAGAGLCALVLFRTRLRFLGLIACVPMFMRTTDRPPAGEFDMTVLDVGHGLAVVVRTAGRTLLFDAGPLSRSGFDAGKEIVVPALNYLSPGQLDAIVISHGDSDHAGGLGAVLAERMPQVLLAGPDIQHSNSSRCIAGQQWVWDDVEFTILHPSPTFSPRGNESSCVLRIAAAGGAVLLTGDIERRAETALVRTGLAQADFVVAPHHGSATSSSAPFVRATRPQYVVVSAAYANRWNFPRPDVVLRWREAGALVLTTGDRGAITATVAISGMNVDSWRDSHVRYWDTASGAGSGSAL